MYQRSHAQIWFGGIRIPLPLENSNLLNSVAKFKNFGTGLGHPPPLPPENKIIPWIRPLEKNLDTRMAMNVYIIQCTL